MRADHLPVRRIAQSHSTPEELRAGPPRRDGRNETDLRNRTHNVSNVKVKIMFRLWSKMNSLRPRAGLTLICVRTLRGSIGVAGGKDGGLTLHAAYRANTWRDQAGGLRNPCVEVYRWVFRWTATTFPSLALSGCKPTTSPFAGLYPEVQPGFRRTIPATSV